MCAGRPGVKCQRGPVHSCNAEHHVMLEAGTTDKWVEGRLNGAILRLSSLESRCHCSRSVIKIACSVDVQ